MPLGSSISLTVRQRGKAIYSVFFLEGSSSVLAVLATILMSATAPQTPTLLSMTLFYSIFGIISINILNYIYKHPQQVPDSPEQESCDDVFQTSNISSLALSANNFLKNLTMSFTLFSSSPSLSSAQAGHTKQ